MCKNRPKSPTVMFQLSLLKSSYTNGFHRVCQKVVQLAKAAVYAGISRLLSLAGKSMRDLGHILLAGGFGKYLNILRAITNMSFARLTFEQIYPNRQFGWLWCGVSFKV